MPRNRKMLLVTAIDVAFLSYIIIANIFGVVFFYKIFSESIILAVLPITIVHLAYGFIVVKSAKIVGRIGTRASFLIGIFLFITTTIPLVLFDQYPHWLLVAIWIVIYVLARAFYLPAMIFNFIKSTSYEARGTDLSIAEIGKNIVRFVLPIATGFAATEYGLTGMFLLAAGIMLLSFIPAYLLPDYRFELDIDYEKATNSSRFNAIKRIIFFRDFGAAAGSVIWTVILFLGVGSSFTNLGIVNSVTTGLSVLIAFFLGRILNKYNRFSISRVTNLFEGGIFMLVGALATVVPTPILDAVLKLALRMNISASDVVLLDTQSVDVQDDHLDEVVTLRETLINVVIAFGLLVWSMFASVTSLEVAIVAIGVFQFVYLFFEPKQRY